MTGVILFFDKMALYYDLPDCRDTYKLILKIFECTKYFSKDYKYTLGQYMKLVMPCNWKEVFIELIKQPKNGAFRNLYG